MQRRPWQRPVIAGHARLGLQLQLVRRPVVCSVLVEERERERERERDCTSQSSVGASLWALTVAETECELQ